ncbi:hypothetical protein [Peribacillus frigoritolerans]|uniref:hypothetical protein n=1 Tax=Peribacillus frigoritolerans TaxID=450367 RepID=UPI002415BF1B|nr:hypothetical protein [Peribacillus frigoritolerans]MDG4850362.1 hypothetical protein [Peribacillus frigoritolerans]
MANTNRVQNGGFEQSTGTVAPFWTEAGVTGVLIDNGTQLLGNTHGVLFDFGSNISQEMLPLQVGEIYEFSMGVSNSGAIATTGTIDIAITGNPVRSFQAANLLDTNDYIQYSLTFQAIEANSTLTITNNTNKSLSIDVVSVFRK